MSPPGGARCAIDFRVQGSPTSSAASPCIMRGDQCTSFLAVSRFGSAHRRFWRCRVMALSLVAQQVVQTTSCLARRGPWITCRSLYSAPLSRGSGAAWVALVAQVDRGRVQVACRRPSTSVTRRAAWPASTMPTCGSAWAPLRGVEAILREERQCLGLRASLPRCRQRCRLTRSERQTLASRQAASSLETCLHLPLLSTRLSKAYRRTSPTLFTCTPC